MATNNIHTYMMATDNMAACKWLQENCNMQIDTYKMATDIATHAHTYIHTYIHTYMHAYIHACIHTYTHIHT